MAYDGKVMRRALARFDEQKQRRAEALRRREEEICARSPRIAEINAELSHTMAKLISAGLIGGDASGAVDALREENLALQRERGRLLRDLGYPEDALSDAPACPLCGDKGWIGSEMCSCLKKIYTEEQTRELSQMLDLGTQSFDTFSFDYYSDLDRYGRRRTARENMEHNYETCVEFARHFPSKLGNLLLSGGAGLGKTFLSACIAREVSGKGRSVVYDTAAHVFERFETQKFSRDGEEEADGDVERILRCDLFILDDLGTELTTPFVTSALYRILNTRLTAARPTVISTNLNPEEIGHRYGEAILSRILGSFELLPFFGEDIRRIKRSRRE